MIESLNSARLVEHNIIGEMKSQFFIGVLYSEFPATAFIRYTIYSKINKNRNTKVCSTIPLSKKSPHIENSQPICIAN